MRGRSHAEGTGHGSGSAWGVGVVRVVGRRIYALIAMCRRVAGG